MKLTTGEATTSGQNVIIPYAYTNDAGETVESTLTNTEPSLTVEQVQALLVADGERLLAERAQAAKATELAAALSNLEVVTEPKAVEPALDAKLG